MLKLWVKDNKTGTVHEYGTDKHDSLVLQEDGSLHYENLECSAGTKFPEEGYSFCREDGTIPSPDGEEEGYLNIGGDDFRPAPVRYGRWILRDANGNGVCSRCNRQDHIDPQATHCRYCGAEMILEDKV